MNELTVSTNEAATIQGTTAGMMLDMEHKLFNVAFPRGVVSKWATIEGSIKSQVGDFVPSEDTSERDHRKEIH